MEVEEVMTREQLKGCLPFIEDVINEDTIFRSELCLLPYRMPINARDYHQR